MPNQAIFGIGLKLVGALQNCIVDRTAGISSADPTIAGCIELVAIWKLMAWIPKTISYWLARRLRVLLGYDF